MKGTRIQKDDYDIKIIMSKEEAETVRKAFANTKPRDLDEYLYTEGIGKVMYALYAAIGEAI